MIAGDVGSKWLMLALLANVVICDESVFFPGASNRKQYFDSEESQGTMHFPKKCELFSFMFILISFRQFGMQDII